MNEDEILFVVGHEMGHYLLHHVWILVFVISASILVFCFLTSLLVRRMIDRFAARFGFARLSDLASFPLVFLFISLFGFLFSPVTNGVWRHFEHEADVYAMDHTRDGDAAARAFEKLAAANLSNPNPSAFIEFWLYDHPTLADRVNFVRSYSTPGAQTDSLHVPGERHLKNIRQLTFGGENAEAYFYADGRKLILQSTRDTFPCDQIFTMNIDGSNVRLVSRGKGVTTCSFFAPDGGRIIYSSTHLGADSCPPKPSYEQGYVWALYPHYDVFSAKPDGNDPVRLTDTPGYDAEAVFSPDGSLILFTSVRDGDLELYVMDPQGNNVRRLTQQIGYDGGAFFSPDNRRIVYRAHHPETPEDIADYQALLKQNLVRPSQMELFVMDADGSNRRQVTKNGAANFCPYFHPDGRRIIFASNMEDPHGHNFELYLINDDGTGLERVTYNDTFDAFPMFSRDGTKLVFASNRNNTSPRETNIFLADWVE
jgi:Tol biopolymer transport system component